ncbi:MAG: hypothetical protein HQM16_15040 [Deltaproteobacteria bacterium]|nr:hypothetical protein [Deltaproteobacteria bacterium]
MAGTFTFLGIHYIFSYFQHKNQTKHHHKKSFQEEFLEFLKANDIEYDEKYIWK